MSFFVKITYEAAVLRFSTKKVFLSISLNENNEPIHDACTITFCNPATICKPIDGLLTRGDKSKLQSAIGVRLQSAVNWITNYDREYKVRQDFKL